MNKSILIIIVQGFIFVLSRRSLFCFFLAPAADMINTSTRGRMAGGAFTASTQTIGSRIRERTTALGWIALNIHDQRVEER